jgi:hypothetical protein
MGSVFSGVGSTHSCSLVKSSVTARAMRSKSTEKSPAFNRGGRESTNRREVNVGGPIVTIMPISPCVRESIVVRIRQRMSPNGNGDLAFPKPFSPRSIADADCWELAQALHDGSTGFQLVREAGDVSFLLECDSPIWSCGHLHAVLHVAGECSAS